MKIFESWRDAVITNSDESCRKIQDDELDLFYKDSDIKNVPRCLVQMTKQICHCDFDCVFDSFKKFRFDSECLLYDIQDLFISVKHYDCDMLDKRIINGVLSTMKTDFDNMIFAQIFINLDELCDNKPKAMEKLQCIMYELKKSCKGSNVCNKFRLSDCFTRHCLNQNFRSQINDIERSIDIYSTDYTGHDFIRGVRSIQVKNNLNEIDFDQILSNVDQRYYKSIGVNLKNFTIAPFFVLGVCILLFCIKAKLKHPVRLF